MITNDGGLRGRDIVEALARLLDEAEGVAALLSSAANEDTERGATP